MGCVRGLLLVFGFIDWRVEEGNSEVKREDLGVRVLLGEFMGVGEAFLCPICEVHARSHVEKCT